MLKNKKMIVGLLICSLGFLLVYFLIMKYSSGSVDVDVDVKPDKVGLINNRFNMSNIGNDYIMKKLIEGLDKDVSSDEYSKIICEVNKIDDCSYNNLLNHYRVVDSDIKPIAVNYFNAYSFNFLGSKQYDEGKYDLAMLSIQFSIFYTERLPLIDDSFRRVLMIKYAGISKAYNEKYNFLD